MTSIDVRSGLNGAPTSVSDRDTGAVDPGGSTPGDDRWPEDTPRAGLRRLGYQPALDGLRGLALVAIVVYHAELPGAPGAFLSVSTFFTLSGFLITALAMTEFASTCLLYTSDAADE